MRKFKDMLVKIKFYYNTKWGYKHYIGFWKDSNEKIHFTFKGLSFRKNS